jgi:predicted amidohydrolase YtcJ
MATAHAAGRPVAVHCVTADALALLLAAWAEVGAWPTDRVEHGAVIPAAALPALAALGVTVVTQPGFVAERGDRYRAEIDESEQADLWRCATLLRGGIGVAGGTDAPYGPADPWRAMAAAVDRRTPSGAVLGADEGLDPQRALGLFLGTAADPGGPSRRIEPGAPGDLCVLDRPRREAFADLAAVEVTASFVAGAVVTA